MIRKLKKSDAQQAASVHYTNLSEDFLASFGPEFMTVLYESLIASPLVETYGYFHKNIVVGVIVGTTNTSKLLKSIFLERFFSFTPYVVKKLLTQPSILPRFIETLLYSKKHTAHIDAELLALYINPSFRRKGIGSQLFKELFAGMKKKSVTHFKVGTHHDNQAANLFYKSRGGIYLSSFKQYGAIWNSYSFTVPKKK